MPVFGLADTIDRRTEIFRPDHMQRAVIDRDLIRITSGRPDLTVRAFG